MRKSLKITFSGLCAALATIIMITAYFPYLTYATPAIASLVIMVCFIEIDAKWAVACYLASILPIFLTAEIESNGKSTLLPKATLPYILLSVTVS